jgi:hypothetical protein
MWYDLDAIFYILYKIEFKSILVILNVILINIPKIKIKK